MDIMLLKVSVPILVTGGKPGQQHHHWQNGDKKACFMWGVLVFTLKTTKTVRAASFVTLQCHVLVFYDYRKKLALIVTAC